MTPEAWGGLLQQLLLKLECAQEANDTWQNAASDPAGLGGWPRICTSKKLQVRPALPLCGPFFKWHVFLKSRPQENHLGNFLNMLSHNSHTIQFTHLKRAIRWSCYIHSVMQPTPN